MPGIIDMVQALLYLGEFWRTVHIALLQGWLGLSRLVFLCFTSCNDLHAGNEGRAAEKFDEAWFYDIPMSSVEDELQLHTELRVGEEKSKIAPTL